MECDLTPLIGILTTVGVLIAAAAVAVGVAVALSGGFFSAPAAPAAMVVASVSSGIAAGMLGIGARIAIDDFFRCMGSPPECLQLVLDLQTVIAALATVLLLQAVAAGVVAGYAWIPGAGIPAMGVILAALLLQLPLIPAAIGLIDALIDCARDASIGRVIRPLLVTTVVLVGLATTGIFVIRRAIGIGNEPNGQNETHAG